MVFINASGHQNIFSPLFRLKEGQNIRNKHRARKPRKKRKLKIQTNEGQQLIIPPELYQSFQRCPPPDLHQQCLNLIRLRALEQALCLNNIVYQPSQMNMSQYLAFIYIER